MAVINWTAEAELWMKDIFDYISKDNPKAARKVINGIYDSVQMLEKNPRLGHAYKREVSKNI